MPTLVFYPGILLPVVSPIDAGTNLVTASAVSTFNVEQRVTASVTSTWTLFANIDANVLSSFNVRAAVVKITPFQIQGYLPRPITWPVDYQRYIPGVAWNIYDLVETSKLSSFAVIQTRNSVKRSTFNVSSSSVHADVSASFNTHSLVQAQSASIEWNLKKTVTALKKSTFDTMISAFAQKLVKFNTNGLLVTPSVQSTWNTHKLIIPSVLSSFHLNSNRFARKISTFETLSSVTASKTSRYNVHNPVIVQSVSCQWNVRKQLTPSVSSRWAVRTRPSANSNLVSWRILNRLTKVQQSSFRVGINPNGQVTAVLNSSFNDLSRLDRSETVFWITVGNAIVAAQSQYNVLEQQIAKIESQWIIGPWINSHIRQLAQERIDFAY